MTVVKLPKSNVTELKELEADSEELNVGINERGSNGLMKKQEFIEQQKYEIDLMKNVKKFTLRLVK